ncbi:hypothetical protein R1flu_025804 [Riccia fluitans]|uniref:Plasma membrane H+-ATPase n=1 Tax=Riccia fluitans TaxID=41844 RepID=A0ABD1XZ01_9MARC
MALMTVVFYFLMHETEFFEKIFKVRSVKDNQFEETAVMYLQVSVISQALIFVTRSKAWSFLERPGLLLVVAFAIAQLIATIIAVYANWDFAKIAGCGWGWAGITWLYNIIWYLPLDAIKIVCRYLLTGDAWRLVTEQKVAFTRQRNYGQQARQAQWVAFAKRDPKGNDPFVLARKSIMARASLAAGQGAPKPKPPRMSILSLRPAVATIYHVGQNVARNVSHMVGELVHPNQRSSRAPTRKGREAADKARRRAELARLRETHTLKGHLESVARLKGLDGAADNFYTFNPLFRLQQDGQDSSSNPNNGAESSNRRYSIS